MTYRKLVLTSSQLGHIALTASVAFDDPLTYELVTSQPFGSVKWVISDHKKFWIWHAVYEITKPVHLRVSYNQECLSAWFTLKNTMPINIRDLKPLTMPENHLTFGYVPHFQLDHYLLPKTYSLMGLCFKLPQFYKWSHIFPALEDFFMSAKKHTPLQFPNMPRRTPAQLSALLLNITNCTFTGQLRKKYIHTKVTDITMLLLQLLQVTEDYLYFSQSDHARIRAVHDFLVENPASQLTIHQLAHQFGINDFKLKRGFKQIYSSSVYAFLINLRMQRAMDLILGSDLSMSTIATQVGYMDSSSFSSAFKRVFGFAPSVMRQRGP